MVEILNYTGLGGFVVTHVIGLLIFTMIGDTFFACDIIKDEVDIKEKGF
ncbi:MAG: hypothetical protein OIF32_03705 [Campylobacterales bacterium]|nr:hypothetical protein [Campylobacterales bacterium]